MTVAILSSYLACYTMAMQWHQRTTLLTSKLKKSKSILYCVKCIKYIQYICIRNIQITIAARYEFGIVQYKINSNTSIVHFCVLSTSDSNAMEPLGLHRYLDFLKEAKIQTAILTSGRHVTIRKIMRLEYANIIHHFDVWHIVKKNSLLLTNWSLMRHCQCGYSLSAITLGGVQNLLMGMQCHIEDGKSEWYKMLDKKGSNGSCKMETKTTTTIFTITKRVDVSDDWLSRFLTAHQHHLGYLVPLLGKMWVMKKGSKLVAVMRLTHQWGVCWRRKSSWTTDKSRKMWRLSLEPWCWQFRHQEHHLSTSLVRQRKQKCTVEYHRHRRLSIAVMIVWLRR